MFCFFFLNLCFCSSGINRDNDPKFFQHLTSTEDSENFVFSHSCLSVNGGRAAYLV